MFFTDPQRTPEPEAVAARLPRGAAVVFRAFGAADAGERAVRLRAVTRRKGLLLLIGADARLADACSADGVHLPERLAAHARRLKAAHPRWIVTAAAHGLAAARRGAAAGADAVVVSPVFPSASPSAGRPLGPRRMAAVARRAGAPVYGLGGIRHENAPRLLDTGLVGLAAVEGLAGPRT
jgi:thiamine-phosphate pyrophosphorylase